MTVPENAEMFRLSRPLQRARLSSLSGLSGEFCRTDMEEIIDPLRPAYLSPRLHQHGWGHGTACAIWAAVVCRQLGLDPHFTRLLIVAAYLHDARRRFDYEDTEFRHARRGRQYLLDDPDGLVTAIVPEPTERTAIAQAVGSHTLTGSQRRQRDYLRAQLSGATVADINRFCTSGQYGLAAQLWLLLTDVDALDLARGFYAGPVLAPVLRGIRTLRAHVPVMRDRPGAVVSRVVLPMTRSLHLYADALAYLRSQSHRHDQQQAALDAAVQLGLLVA